MRAKDIRELRLRLQDWKYDIEGNSDWVELFEDQQDEFTTILKELHKIELDQVEIEAKHEAAGGWVVKVDTIGGV